MEYIPVGMTNTYKFQIGTCVQPIARSGY